jgi:hypothetical protein
MCLTMSMDVWHCGLNLQSKEALIDVMANQHLDRLEIWEGPE